MNVDDSKTETYERNGKGSKRSTGGNEEGRFEEEVGNGNGRRNDEGLGKEEWEWGWADLKKN